MRSARRLMLAISAAGLLGVGAFSQKTEAAPITGTIDFGGVVTFDTMSLATATRINVWQPFQGGPTGFSIVLQDSGSFSSIASGTQAAMASQWIFNPSTNTPGLWSVGGFTFNLTSCTIATQNANFLDVEGVGIITSSQAMGFDPTPGTWSFTSSNANGQNQTTFSFQGHSAAVPEPGTVTLLGVGVGALISSRKRRAKV